MAAEAAGMNLGHAVALLAAGVVAVPAPVVGLGIPAIAVFGLLYKRMRDRGGR